MGESSMQMLGLDFGSFLSFTLVLTKCVKTDLSRRYSQLVMTHMLHESSFALKAEAIRPPSGQRLIRPLHEQYF